MNSFLTALTKQWEGHTHEFLVTPAGGIRFTDLVAEPPVVVGIVNPGDVVALIGDFDQHTLACLLHLIDQGAIVVPLTTQTVADHDYFFATAEVDVVINGRNAHRRERPTAAHPLLALLRARSHAGLILFSSGTTGRPKAICHDLTAFLSRFATPRTPFRTLSFLLFDHIGGIHTFLHTLYTRGIVIAPPSRDVATILKTCAVHAIEVLPTTPTFLRMLLLSGELPHAFPSSVQIVTYATERMDSGTLQTLGALLPRVDFRQKYGMSELGILRIKSADRTSLFMRIGGEGVETRMHDGVLHIRSATRMLGYLNAPSPFDDHGWYDTRDLVEERDGWYQILGRNDDVVNVGGLKFLLAEVERVLLAHPGVAFAKAHRRENPITGNHVEATVQPTHPIGIDRDEVLAYCKQHLPAHMVPRRVTLGDVRVGHRFKLG